MLDACDSERGDARDRLMLKYVNGVRSVLLRCWQIRDELL